MALRALTIGSRFVLLFALARFLTPGEVGLYGLIAGTISFAMLFVGGEFYTYSQRELLASPKDRWSFVLQHQAIAIALLYVGLLPLQTVFFWFDLLPGRWLVWYVALLIAEHLAQELNRILVAMGRPVLASWVLFMRTALWVWVLLPVLILDPQLWRLEPVFLAWLVGGTIAIGMAVAIVVRDVPLWRRWDVDWTWLRRGFRVGLVYLVATLCFKAMFTADRYVVQQLVGRELLGVYVLYIGIATAVVNFLDSAVFSFLYPRLVAAYQLHERDAYDRVMREMGWSALTVSGGLAVAAGLLAPIALRWIGKDVFAAHLPLLWLLLASAVIQCVGMIPHYALYARRADRIIVVAEITALLVFVLVTGLLARLVPFTAAAWGLVAALSWLAGFKYVSYRRLRT